MHDVKCLFMCYLTCQAPKITIYSQLFLRRTPLGPVLSVHLRDVRLIKSQIKGVKKGRDQL